MKDLNQLTRKQLAEILIDDQISRGIVKAENRAFQIKARLKGFGGLMRPMTKSQLIEVVKSIA